MSAAWAQAIAGVAVIVAIALAVALRRSDPLLAGALGGGAGALLIVLAAVASRP